MRYINPRYLLTYLRVEIVCALRRRHLIVSALFTGGRLVGRKHYKGHANRTSRSRSKGEHTVRI